MYEIAFSKISEIKKSNLKLILEIFGSAESFFKSSRKERIQRGLNPLVFRRVHEKSLLNRAEKELKFIEKEGITIHFYNDQSYPDKLRQCCDAPILLYTKGNVTLNAEKVVSVVGTRACSYYGRDFCEEFIATLASQEITVVSGMAYGIDICAHRSALKFQMPTIGVLGHSLNELYPASHRITASEMMENGGLITEFDSESEIQKGNFPSRNRIIAGMADATVVIESKKKGGSLITADIANSYNRDVFAVPGRVTDVRSEGCNKLIQENLAILLESATDFLNFMNWNDKSTSKPVQTILDFELSSEANTILKLLSEKEDVHIDELSSASGLLNSMMASVLMELELNGLVRPLPGNRYKIKRVVKY